MRVQTKISELISKAVDGTLLSPEEIHQLYLVPVISEESYQIQYASRKIGVEVSRSKAEIHAQVGINLGPCPKNCLFCSFAAANRIFAHSQILPTEQIVEQCRIFEQDGANAIYLMATANFRFADYLEVGRAVKEALRPDTVLVANVGDFDHSGAEALLKVGFRGIYHAVRLGEGIVTGIDPQIRLGTIRAAQEAGLKIGTCVEPVGPEHSLAELVAKTILAREMSPAFSGAARRITIPNTALAEKGMLSEAAMAHILAVVRLATGREVIGNCTHEPNGIGAMAGANLFWAENGSNPRDTSEHTEKGRGFTVAKSAEIFREAGWEVLEGPSVMFRDLR
jgi:biotin synthase